MEDYHNKQKNYAFFPYIFDLSFSLLFELNKLR